MLRLPSARPHRVAAAAAASAALALLGACAAPMSQFGSVSAADTEAEARRQQAFVMQSRLEQVRRLQTLGSPILKAAVPLCTGATAPRYGLGAQSGASFAKAWQGPAATLGFADTLIVTVVIPGSPAAAAGVQRGDRVLAMQGTALPTGEAGVKAYAAALERARKEGSPLRFSLLAGPAVGARPTLRTPAETARILAQADSAIMAQKAAQAIAQDRQAATPAAAAPATAPAATGDSARTVVVPVLAASTPAATPAATPTPDTTTATAAAPTLAAAPAPAPAPAPREVTVVPDTACGYSLELDESSDLNAYADGQRIVVTQRMMTFASDDELRVVLGHELAHNAMKHMNAMKKNATVGGILGAIADVAMAANGINTGGAYTQQGMNAGAMTFSQDFEREADYVGLYVLTLAGGAPEQAAYFWRRMATENPGSIRFASSHPTTPERFVRLEHTAVEIARKQAAGEPLVPDMKPGAKPAAAKR